MRSTRNNVFGKLALVIGIAFLAFFLTLRYETLFGTRPDFLLATLVAASFFLTFPAFVVVVLFEIFLINWVPVLTPEIIVFGVLPPVIFFFRKIIFPFDGWMWNLVATFLCIVLFYGITGFGIALENVSSFFGNTAVSLMFGALIFRLFGYFYEEIR
ncbi:MAG: hypothetical protein AAB652_02585 [Patescibacteria group bacterium]